MPGKRPRGWYRKLLNDISQAPVDLIALATKYNMTQYEMAVFVSKPRHARRLRASRLLTDKNSDLLLSHARSAGAKTLGKLTSTDKPSERSRRASASAFAARPLPEPPPIPRPAPPQEPPSDPATEDDLERDSQQYWQEIAAAIRPPNPDTQEQPPRSTAASHTPRQGEP
jgi:hypothetical protein